MANFFTGRVSYVLPKQGILNLAVGSGFFVRFQGLPVFVTARHILTGRHWTTNEPLQKDGRCPHSISINVPIVEDVADGGRFGFKESIVDLEQNHTQVWSEAQINDQHCDVSCIIFGQQWETGFVERWQAEHAQLGKFKIGCINDYEDWTSTVNREFPVASPAYVLGFPLGLTAGGPNRPIWRGGNIATEPRVDYDGWPVFLIDVAGRNGLSGAAVVSLSEAGTLAFAGVYTGRVLPTDQNSDLGFVWKVSFVNQLLSTALRDLEKRAMQ
ncbi:hypothetical protein [Hyphomonas sp.]|uniref:hypothetical protein n=1 Tax=Hyphomonas sp. TaxID=87 RepID=UPI00391C1AA9